MSGNPRAVRRLRTACEKAKRALSRNLRASIDVDALHDGEDYNCELSHAKYGVQKLTMAYSLVCAVHALPSLMMYK
jgi:molecular chaperone DnaK (HSP70)